MNNFKLRWNPEVSFGHVLQAVLIVIPAVAFFAKIDAKVEANNSTLSTVVMKVDKLDETTNLLARNQAVLTALFEEHKTQQAQQAQKP
jgi:hypothetical protein